MVKEIFLWLAAVALFFTPNKGLLGSLALAFLGIALLIDGLKTLKEYNKTNETQ
jgi:hypothetical protein